MLEEWKDISGFEGIYKISNYGRVLSISTNTIRKSRHNPHGYVKINLSKNSKRYTYTIHRLVLENFNPVDNMDTLQVNHINEIKDDNRFSNLEWTSSKENINHGNHNNKIRKYRQNNSGNGKKKIICSTTGKKFNSISEAARYYGIKAKSNISHCAIGIAKYCGTLADGTPLQWVYCNEKELMISKS
ncbi:NUMOD4 motif family protein [Clostridium botulinum 202F]|nr:NUMOD4 motif family protein [Clostridium botulinum 202F]KAI3344377.1 NUMOD4 motif-containing HNH endonuclease [Clostridium botulinum]KON13553.1 NUMOD4 motif/HNH endonuclease [Clostridium botulinum]MBY6988438.1 HNH endonuclease [Clostridium botulinum]NFH02042.1 endonuclease [Clostridium botulinum]